MAVRISVLGGAHNAAKHRFSKQRDSALESLMKSIVVPALADSVAHPTLPSTYPWCFVISPAFNDKHCRTGAFFIDWDKPEDERLLGLYTRVPFVWLENNVKSSFHVAFWQSRILASLNKREGSADYAADLKEWVCSLQRYYSPFWESFALTKPYRFKSKADDLLTGYNDADSNIRSENGVEIMPWKGWPGCIQTGQYAWLWRQSRHGKIIDSMKISLLGDETNSVC